MKFDRALDAAVAARAARDWQAEDEATHQMAVAVARAIARPSRSGVDFRTALPWSLIHIAGQAVLLWPEPTDRADRPGHTSGALERAIRWHLLPTEEDWRAPHIVAALWAYESRQTNRSLAADWAARKEARDAVMQRLRDAGHRIDGPTPPLGWERMLEAR